MLRIRKAKWAAWLLCLALTCGAMVTTTACGGEDKETGQDDEKDKRGTEETGGRSDKESEGASGAGSGKETPGNVGDDDGEAPGKYGATAARLEERVTAYFEAMKAGDIETVLSMTDPESEVYEKLSGVKDYETAREFFHALYANIAYRLPEAGATEHSLETAFEQGEDEFNLYMDIGMPDDGVLFELFFTVPGVVFQDGTLIPDDYELKSDEEALEMVRSVASVLPLVYQSWIEVKLQEDGSFYFEAPGSFWEWHGYDFYPGENFLPEFLTKIIPTGVIVGKNDGSFARDSEDWTQILSLLKQKDFDGLLALANGDLEKYSYDGEPHSTPGGLTEAQKVRYDDFIQQTRVYVSEVTYDSSKERNYKAILILPATTWYEPTMEWYAQNGIKEIFIEDEFGSDMFGQYKSNQLAFAMNVLLAPVRKGVDHAKASADE